MESVVMVNYFLIARYIYGHECVCFIFIDNCSINKISLTKEITKYVIQALQDNEYKKNKK